MLSAFFPCLYRANRPRMPTRPIGNGTEGDNILSGQEIPIAKHLNGLCMDTETKGVMSSRDMLPDFIRPLPQSPSSCWLSTCRAAAVSSVVVPA